MGGGKSSTTTQTVSIPPEVLARYRAVNARAEAVARQPFQQYGGQFVAGINPTQQAGITGMMNAAGMAQPYFDTASQMTQAGSRAVGPLTARDIARYESPYIRSVVDPMVQALQQQQGQERTMQQAQAIRSGGFGGDRAGLERANLARQQALGMAQAISPIYQQGYQQAVQTAMGQQGVKAQDLQRMLAAGQQYAGLGSGAQAAALQAAQAQIGAGTLEQQTQQADLTARYQQFLQERGYPFQVAQFLANIAMGTGALSGSTTTTTQPSSFFSDERVKENIKPIGETFDGQTIYKYNYKGEPATQIGLIAQEVEKKHPEAVGSEHGIKTVDYDRATEHAGGLGKALASMGGAVFEPGEYSRGGYLAGGVVDMTDLQSILAAQRQGFGPFAQGGIYGQQGEGAPYGAAGGIVPKASLPVPKLVTAGSVPRLPEPGLKQAMQNAEQVADIGQKLGKAYDWVAGTDPKKDPKTGQVIEGTGSPSLGQRVSEGIDKIKELAGTPTAKYGGGIRPHYAAGGSGAINPYDPKKEQLDYFPEEVLESGDGEGRKLMTAGSAPGSSKSGLSDVASAVGAAGTIATGISKIAPMIMSILPFSDARMKENIEPIGKTYDGQNIYRYNLKGDGATRMGLMAQEVLDHKPEAVGKNRDGMLMLDYDRATEEAVPYHGGVKPRHGFATEGAVTQDAQPETQEARDERLIQQFLPRNAQVESGGQNIGNERSSAFGPHQFTKDTWNYTVQKHGLPYKEQDRFNPDAQKVVAPYHARDLIGTFRSQGIDPSYETLRYGWGFGIGDGPKFYKALQENPNMPSIQSAVATPKVVSSNPNWFYHKDGTPKTLAETSQIILGKGGIGGGQPPQTAPAEQKPSGIFSPPREFRSGKPFESWGDFATSRQFLQPLLIGLGTMASSPSRYLGSAILQGLGAGAASYGNLEKQQQEIAESKAREVSGLSGIPISALIGEVGPDGKVTYKVRPDYFGGSLAGPPGGVKPPGAPGAEQPALPGGGLAGAQKTAIETGKKAVEGPISVEAAPGRYNFSVTPQSATDEQFKQFGFSGDPKRDSYEIPARIGTIPANAEKAVKDQAAAQKNIEVAASVPQRRLDTNMLVDAVFNITPSGVAGTGPGQADRARALAVYDWAVKFAGMPGLASDERQNISSAQIIEKIRQQMGPMAAGQLGFHGQALAQAINDAQISGSLTPEAATKLAASMYVIQQRPQDFARYYDAYVKKYGTALDVQQSFDREMAQRDDKEKKALEHALKPTMVDGKQESVVMALRAGKISPQEFDAYYKVPGLARLIVGG